MTKDLAHKGNQSPKSSITVLYKIMNIDSHDLTQVDNGKFGYAFSGIVVNPWLLIWLK